MARVAVIAATGRIGRLLVPRLLDRGHEVVAVARDGAKLATLPAAASRRCADIRDRAALAEALAGAAVVVSCARASFVPDILPCLPATPTRLVLLGSSRKFSRFPDDLAEAVARGEAAFLASGVPGVMLHPTMIYGGQGENNLRRLAAAIRAWPAIPLPGGGRSLVQPIHVDDVIAALIAAAFEPRAPGPPLVIAGPRPMSYAEMVRACAAALGRPVRIVPVPLAIAMALASVTAALPARLRVAPAEVRRLVEDKAFDVADMEARLGVRPMAFADGLARTLAGG